jgi:hypothetical protein
MWDLPVLQLPTHLISKPKSGISHSFPGKYVAHAERGASARGRECGTMRNTAVRKYNVALHLTQYMYRYTRLHTLIVHCARAHNDPQSSKGQTSIFTVSRSLRSQRGTRERAATGTAISMRPAGTYPHYATPKRFPAVLDVIVGLTRHTQSGQAGEGAGTVLVRAASSRALGGG